MLCCSQALEKAGGIVENITWELFKETLLEQAEQVGALVKSASSRCCFSCIFAAVPKGGTGGFDTYAYRVREVFELACTCGSAAPACLF
jgi:hypothetical protein